MALKHSLTLLTALVLLCPAVTAQTRTQKYTACDEHKYQSNMTITAVVVDKGWNVVNDCEVAVFDANGECRCSRLNDPQQGNLVFLTIQGEGSGEKLTFKVVYGNAGDYREETCPETVTFVNDSSLGSEQEPFKLNISQWTGVGNVLKDKPLAEDEIYNLLGQRVSHMVKGQIYIVNGKKVFGK
ncbi:MAG: hypothetical protein IK000_00775 [Bacteroidaceae bacterium]|nr:hypothetical protein [Bacteroidaceae bacterium]